MTDPNALAAPPIGARPALVVTHGGQHLHVDTCWIARQAARKTGWASVDQGNSGDVAREVATSDLLVCKKCKPISRLAWWERYHRHTT